MIENKFKIRPHIVWEGKNERTLYTDTGKYIYQKFINGVWQFVDIYKKVVPLTRNI